MAACHGIIPARYASSRFEGKPLAMIGDYPMFWHVYVRARQCKALASVTLATDDARIAAAAVALDVPCLITRHEHPSGTDRVYEAACQLGLAPEAVVVNIQGDEPLLVPAMLDELVAPFADAGVCVTTLCMAVSAVEAASPNRVKVVTNARGDALYFSRACLPYVRDPHEAANVCYQGHVGVYAFRMSALASFVASPASRLEQLEKLEQLRFLDNAIPIRVVPTAHKTYGVDTPEDLERVRTLFAENHS